MAMRALVMHSAREVVARPERSAPCTPALCPSKFDKVIVTSPNLFDSLRNILDHSMKSVVCLKKKKCERKH